MVICALCDAPSIIAQEVHHVLVDGSHFFGVAGTNMYDWVSDEYYYFYGYHFYYYYYYYQVATSVRQVTRLTLRGRR